MITTGQVCCSNKDLPVVEEPGTALTEDRPGCLLQVFDPHHDNDDDDGGSVVDDVDVDEQDDRPAVCVPFSSCSPFMEMMANLRKPLHPSAKD